MNKSKNKQEVMEVNKPQSTQSNPKFIFYKLNSVFSVVQNKTSLNFHNFLLNNKTI